MKYLKNILNKNKTFTLISFCLFHLSVVADPAHLPKKPIHLPSWLENEYKKVIENTNKAELKNVNIVMLGDSITSDWDRQGKNIWNKTFNDPKSNLYAVNMGISGDATHTLLHRILPKSKGGEGHLDSTDLNPKVISLKIGINNTFAHKKEDITNGIKAVIKSLRIKKPQSKILVLSILPSKEVKRNIKFVNAINHDLENFIIQKKDPMVSYYNLGIHFINSDGHAIEEYYRDDLHLTPKGYQLWAEMIAPVYEGLLYPPIKIISTPEPITKLNQLEVRFNSPAWKGFEKYIYVTENKKENLNFNSEKLNKIKGNFSFNSNRTVMIFTPEKKFSSGSLISIHIPQMRKVFRTLIQETKNHSTLKIKVKDINENSNAIKLPMDILLPKSKTPTPVIIYVHGGGWSGGDENSSIATLPPGKSSAFFASQGIAVIGTSYRCRGSNGTFAKAMIDLKKAVNYIKNNSKKFNIDLKKIFFMGESAGAPLAALLAFKEQSTMGFIGYEGIYDFTKKDNSLFGKGNAYGQRSPDPKSNSAIYQIPKNPPPVLLIHGTLDRTIDVDQSVQLAQKVENLNGHAELFLYKGQKHWSFHAPNSNFEMSCLFQIKYFIDKQLEK